MTDLQSLYAGICARPDEDTPRLMLADFLDEEGGKDNVFRAEVIRTHCRLAREEPWSVPWRELNECWRVLETTVRELELQRRLPWLAHLKGRVRAWSLERGLVGHLTLFSKRFVAEGDSYFEQDPIRSVKFVKLTSAAGTVKPAELFACPHMGRIVKLDLEGSGLKDADLTRLAASPCAKVLRSLSLSWDNPFGAPAAPKLLRAMPELTEFSAQGNGTFGDAHAKALAKCTEFSRLRVLDIGWTSVNAEGIEAIVFGKHTGPLRVLKLSPAMQYSASGEYGSGHTRKEGIAIVEALAASKSLGHLQELDLSHRGLGDRGATVLAGAAKALPALRRLHLDGCGLTIKGAKALAESALGGRLLYINLCGNTNLEEDQAKLKQMFPSAHVQEPFFYDE
jgi:uncharacterized protein (TIGR02996 family)